MKAATIGDIARMVGVSKTTVSRVITSKGYVEEGTRKKIEAAIKELNYTPSLLARSLSKQQTNTIAVIIPEVENPFFSNILKGISDVLYSRNMTMVLCNTNNDYIKDESHLLLLKQQRIRGLIFTPAIDYSSPEMFNHIKNLLYDLNAPVVLLDRHIEGVAYDSVLYDNYSSTYMAVKTLAECGHKTIGIVTGDLNLSIGRERYKGFVDAMKKYSLELDERFILRGDFTIDTAYRLMKPLCYRNELPSAIIASNNLSAYGTLKAIFEQGLKIPNDISFICVDRLEWIDVFHKDISYIGRDVEKMGRTAAELLLKRIVDNRIPTEKTLMMPFPFMLGSEKLYDKNRKSKI